MSDMTSIFDAIQRGDEKAQERLLPLVYAELRRMAAGKMAAERPGQTLQTTALVHEAWLRLGGNEQQVWQNRAHFFTAAAEAMRYILIDRARKKQAVRHGGGRKLQALAASRIAAPLSAENDEQLLAVHAALDKLAAHDAAKAEVVKLRYFAGMTIEETAGVLGISERTAKRHWTYARAWLFREIQRA
jgi:RNA polymerase sigma factor (TIGR02999 family)